MDRLPPLRLLVVYETVCRLGSMQRAAQALNVTPPAVTQAIRSLEEDIGVTLLDRSAKPAVPTDAGERLAWATRNGLGQIEAAIGDIRLTAGISDQQLTICCSLGMATHWLMPRLSGFYARFPDITVNVQAPPTDLPLLSPGIDIALRYGRGGWTDGETSKLFDEIACPVGLPDVIDAAKRAGPLTDARLIEVRSEARNQWHTWSDYFQAKALTRTARANHVFDNYVQAVQAALDGRGVMLGWRSISERLVEDGTLVEWPGGTCDFGSAYYVTCANSSLRKPPAKRFMEWLRADTG